MSENPLKAHMRHEKLYVKLPSNGFFYNENDITLSETTDEVGVKSMTAGDELSLSTPDALLNGESVSTVIKSCCDSIKNPMKLTTADIDVLLIAIKIASYGEFVDAKINCPECDKELEYQISLPHMISNLTYNEPEYVVALGKDINVYLKPNTFTSIVKLSLKSIEAANIFRNFSEDEKADFEKTIKYTQEFQKIANLNFDILMDGILRVEIINGDEIIEVENIEHIADWLMDLSKDEVEKIKNKLTKINSVGIDKSMEFKCSECEHIWVDDVDLNPLTFFMEGF